MKTARAMVDCGFVKAGYRYLNIGDGWSAKERDEKTGSLFADAEKLGGSLRSLSEELGSLGKVSSGGELSRITLAVMTALAAKNESATLIFDEIDTGVSGGTSERIGIMLKRLSENAQVIAVTHSPQIASIAPCHLLIEKHGRDGRTESEVREIEGDERTAEIARIIGGIDVTEKQNAAAEEMLAKSGTVR